MKTTFCILGAALTLGAALSAQAQTTLQLDDGDMEQFWSLTSPNAGPDDWVGVAYDAPFEFPFRVVNATMYFADTFCCTGGICSTVGCPNVADWERRVVTSADLQTDPVGLTPNVTTPILSQVNVGFAGPGSTATTPPWTLTPDNWVLPAATVFDAPGRIFYAIKYFNTDQYMRFAVDDDGAIATNGFGIHTSDGFSTRASLWSFGNIGMRVTVVPIFFMKPANTPLAPRFTLENTNDVPMLSVRMGADAASTTINQFRITSSGSGNDAIDVQTVRLVVDLDESGTADAGEPVIATGSYGTDNGTLTLNPNRTLGAGAVEEWLVVYDFNGAPVGGDTFAARVDVATDVNATGVGAPYVSGTTGGTGGQQGPTVTIAGQLSVSLGPQSMAASVVPSASQDVGVIQVRLLADNETFSISSLTFNADGSLHDVADLTNVTLVADLDSDGGQSAGDAVLGSQAFSGDDGEITFSFTPRAVAANTAADFVLVYDVAATAAGGADFRAILASPDDVDAAGTASGPVPAFGDRALAGTPVIGNLATIGGALTVQAGAANPANATTQPGAADVAMLQLQMSAQAEAVSLDVLSFAASGSGNDSTQVTSAVLYRDVNGNGLVDQGQDVQIGLPQSYASDDGIISFAITGEIIPAGASRLYLLAYDFDSNPSGGETFAAQLTAAASVSARGQASNATIDPSGTFPIVGGTRTMLGGLSIVTAPENPPSSNVQPGALDVPVLALVAAAQGETFTVTGVNLTAAGSLIDNAAITAIEFWLDAGVAGVRDGADVLIGTATYPNDDGIAAATLTTARVIAAGGSERWLITYDLNLTAQPGQTFRTEIADGNAVSATGSLSGPSTPLGLPATGNDQGIGGTIAVQAGTANPLGGSVEPDLDDVVMLQLRVAADLEPVSITSITFTGSGTGNELTAIDRVRLFVDSNANGVFDVVGDLPLGIEQSFTSNDGTVTFAFAARTVAAGANENWIVVYDFAGAALAGETFSVALQGATDVVATAPSGPIPRVVGAPVTGADRTMLGALQVSQAPQNPNARTVARDSTGVAVLALRLSSSGEDFQVTELRVNAAGSVDDANDISALTLIEDRDGDGTNSAGDVVVGSVGFSGDDGIASFVGMMSSVGAGQDLDLLLLADFTGTGLGNTTFRVNIAQASNFTATGFGGRPVVPSGLPISSDTITVGGRLNVQLGNNSPLAAVVRPGDANIPAMQIRTLATTEPVTLTSLTLHASGTGNDATGLAAVDLYLDANGDGVASAGEPVLGTETFLIDDGSVTFALSQGVQVGPAVHLLALVAVTPTPLGGETFQFSVDPEVDVTIATTSGAVTIDGVALDGALLTTGGGLDLSLGPNSSTGVMVNQALQNVPVMQLSFSAVNETCTVQSLTLRAAGSIDDATDIAEVRLMRDVNGDGLVDAGDLPIGAPATYALDDGTITLAQLGATILANTQQDWLLVYDLSGTASNLENFSARLEGNTDVVVSCSISGPLLPAGAPIESASFTIQEDGALVIARGTNTPPARFLSAGSVRTAVAQLRVSAIVQDLTLDLLTLTASVTTPLPSTTVAGIELFRDVNQDGVLDRSDELLHAGSAPDANGNVVFDQLALSAPVTEAVFLLASVNIAADAPPGAQFTLGFVDDANAAATSGFGPALITGAPIAGNRMTIAGNLNISSPTAPTPLVVTNDASDIVGIDLAAEGLFENFRLRSVTVTSQGSMDPATAVLGLNLVSDDNDNGEVDPTDRTVVAGVRFPEGAQRAVFAGLDELMAPSETRRFLITVDLDGVAQVNQSLELSIAANVDVLADGESIGLTSPVGAPILGNSLSIGPSLLVRNGPAALIDTVVTADAESVSALQLEWAAFNEDVTVSRLTLQTSGTLDDQSGISGAHLLLDVDGNGLVDPQDVEVAAMARPAGDDGPITFAPLAERLVRNQTATYLVTLDFSGNGNAGETVLLTLASDADMTAFGALSGAIPTAGAPVAGSQLALVGALNVRLGTASPSGIGVEPGSRFPALQLDLFTKGEAVNVSGLQLSTRGSAPDDQVILAARLFDDIGGDGVVSDADPLLSETTVSADDGVIGFTGIGLSIDADQVRPLLIELTIAEAAPTGGDLRLGFEDNADLEATGVVSGAITTVGAPLVGSAFTIVDAQIVVPPTNPDEGCGCSTSHRASSQPWWRLGLTFVLLGLAMRRRRQR